MKLRILGRGDMTDFRAMADAMTSPYEDLAPGLVEPGSDGMEVLS